MAARRCTRAPTRSKTSGIASFVQPLKGAAAARALNGTLGECARTNNWTKVQSERHDNVRVEQPAVAADDIRIGETADRRVGPIDRLRVDVHLAPLEGIPVESDADVPGIAIGTAEDLRSCGID